MISDILFDLSDDLIGQEGLPVIRSTVLPEALKALDAEMAAAEYTKTYNTVDQACISRIREDLKNIIDNEDSSVKRFGDRVLESANFLLPQ